MTITIRNIMTTNTETQSPVPVAPWRMFTRLARIATADATKMIISLVVYSIGWMFEGGGIWVFWEGETSPLSL